MIYPRKIARTQSFYQVNKILCMHSMCPFRDDIIRFTVLNLKQLVIEQYERSGCAPKYKKKQSRYMFLSLSSSSLSMHIAHNLQITSKLKCKLFYLENEERAHCTVRTRVWAGEWGIALESYHYGIACASKLSKYIAKKNEHLWPFFVCYALQCPMN